MQPDILWHFTYGICYGWYANFLLEIIVFAVSNKILWSLRLGLGILYNSPCTKITYLNQISHII